MGIGIAVTLIMLIAHRIIMAVLSISSEYTVQLYEIIYGSSFIFVKPNNTINIPIAMISKTILAY